MIKVKVKIHGHVRSLLHDKREDLEISLSRPTTVSDMIQKEMGVNPLIFASVVVNGKRQKRDFLIDADADILLVSPVAGG